MKLSKAKGYANSNQFLFISLLNLVTVFEVTSTQWFPINPQIPLSISPHLVFPTQDLLIPSVQLELYEICVWHTILKGERLFVKYHWLVSMSWTLTSPRDTFMKSHFGPLSAKEIPLFQHHPLWVNSDRCQSTSSVSFTLYSVQRLSNTHFHVVLSFSFPTRMHSKKSHTQRGKIRQQRENSFIFEWILDVSRTKKRGKVYEKTDVHLPFHRFLHSSP